MKRSFLLLFAYIFIWAGADAQTNAQFNSTSDLPLDEVKANLQSHCWYISGFDVNNNGWSPSIEGDGAIVSGAACTANQQSGIYTPLLDVAGSIHLSFKYKLNSALDGASRRWIRICLTDYDNNIQTRLDSLEINGNNVNTRTYNKNLPGSSGCYKVYINYQGVGGTSCVAIDDIKINAPLLFADGCAQNPSAANDQFNGTGTRYASGNVMTNDFYPPYSSTVYLVTNSPDGNVALNDDGSFSFTPNAGFNGSSTNFAYKICDNSICSPLCSDDATAMISFPAIAFLPASLVDFTGLYRNDGNVEIGWVTTFEQNTAHFEIERSFDGTEWKNAGKIKSQGNSSASHSYTFTDHVGKNTANNKDLYYRLKQVDLDNKISVSRILVVRVYNTHSLKMISVTPNPARNDIAANIQLNEASVVVLKMMTAGGNQLMKKVLRLREGSNNILMDGTSKLSPGMYLLEVIINSEERMIVKLIKE